MRFFKDLSLSAFTAGFVAVLVGFTSSVAIVFQAAQAFHGVADGELRGGDAEALIEIQDKQRDDAGKADALEHHGGAQVVKVGRAALCK